MNISCAMQSNGSGSFPRIMIIANHAIIAVKTFVVVMILLICFFVFVLIIAYC